MKRWQLVLLVLVLTWCLPPARTAASDCRCNVKVGIGDKMAKSVTIGFTTPTIVPVEGAPGVKIGFAITLGWGTTQEVVQTCECYFYCCPNVQAVDPFVGMAPVVFEVEAEPDPLIPMLPRWEERRVSPVPEPVGPASWDCPDCQLAQVPRICTGTWRQTYSRAGVYLGIGVRAAVGPVSVSLPILKSPGSTLYVAPSSCLEQENREPQFLEVPEGVCLGVNQEKALTFVVYDPDGPEDIVTVGPSDPWPAGVTVTATRSREIDWQSRGEGRATLRAKQFVLDIRVDESYGGEPLRFEAVDTGERATTAIVPLEVIQPIEISVRDQEERWVRTRTADGSSVSVLVQEFELVIRDPNPLPPPGPVFTYCVKTKYGRGELLIDSMSDVPCKTSYTSTARTVVTFIPDPDAEGEEDEVVVLVSQYRCGTRFVHNGFPVGVRVSAAPDISVSPAELTTHPGGSVQAAVTATDPDGDTITLTQTSGPGTFARVEGVGSATGTWSWTVPQAYGGSPWGWVEESPLWR